MTNSILLGTVIAMTWALSPPAAGTMREMLLVRVSIAGGGLLDAFLQTTPPALLLAPLPKANPAISGSLGLSRGGLDREAFQRVLREHEEEIRSCYEQELENSPALRGKVALQLTVNARGEVTKVELVESTLGNERVENCMIARSKKWKFPQREGGGELALTHGWLFRPPEEP